MTGELRELKPRNILALGLCGFSGAFALFLLRGLFLGRPGLMATGLDLAAATLLIVACAISWPSVLAPGSARVSWRTVALVVAACAMTLAARMPALQA